MSEQNSECDKNQLITRVKELVLEREKIFNKLFEIFKQEMKDFISQNNYIGISFRIRNHEWNDGDSTYFSFGWDYADIEKNDGLEEGVPLDFCEKYPNDFWEFHFSEYYGRIYFSIKDGELKIE